MNSSGQFVSRSYDGSSSHRNNSGYTLETGKWYHVAAVFSGGSSTNYVNGVKQGSTASCPSGSTVTEYYYLGWGYITGSAFLDGQLDEARIWSDVRTVEELQEYICEDVSSESNLIAYYRMTNGSGTTLTDNSTNLNTGTLYGGSVTWKTDYLVPSGAGTSGDKYQIQTLNHLWWISKNSGEWGKFFKQTADIDMTVTQNWNDDHSGDAEGFTPIGSGTGTYFTGNYDGQEHTISNLYIDRATTSHQALFGLPHNATIANLGVVDCNITGNWTNGGLAGLTYEACYINNCFSSGSVTGVKYVGGLVGNNGATMANCYSTVSVTVSSSIAGGLFGYNNGAVTNCYSSGSVSGSTSSVGGLVGNNDGTITDSFWDTQISGQSSSDGGTGKTTAEMKNIATFTDETTVGLTSAWDFTGNPNDDSGTDDYWSIDGSNNSGYPWLSWEEYDPVSITWQGDDISSPTDWNTAANWSLDAVPTVLNNPIINSGGNQPVIAATGTATCNNLTIYSGATLTINSASGGTGSLIVVGTATGNVTAQRYVDEITPPKGDQKWHYISSPVASQSLDNDWMSANLIAQASNDQYMFYRFDEDKDYWIYYGYTGTEPEAFGDATFVEARGYAATRTAAGTYSFTGSVRTSDITYSASYTADKGHGFNLIGNPFTSSIGVTGDATSTQNFLAQNTAILNDSYEAVYIWDEAAGYDGSNQDYKTISNAATGYTNIDQDYIQPGQAFMVRVASAGDIVFNKNMQAHSSDAYYKKEKEVWPSIELVAKNSELFNSTAIGFNSNMTLGLDPSYDVGKLKGNPNIALYTKLIEDNGVDFAIQTLPTDNSADYIIPVGLDVLEETLIEFSINTEELTETDIIFEDRENGTFTDLKKESYSTTVSDSGVGRFFLHIGAVNSIENPITKTNITAYFVGNSLLIKNPENQKGEYQLFDLQGKIVKTGTLNGSNMETKNVNIPTGVYILKIKTNLETRNAKIVKM